MRHIDYDLIGVRGLVIGRFQKRSEMTLEKIRSIVAAKAELADMPVICGVDFGHTDPYITFPIGGRVSVTAFGTQASLNILTH